MDAPGRADDSVIVVHHNMAGFGRLAAHVEYGLAFGNLEVGVDLHAALVGVAGHGVPVAARLQSGHAHGKLAGFQHAGVDKLVDGALVAGFQGAQRALGSVSQGDQLGFVTAMGRSTDHIELGGLGGIIAGKGNFLGALGDVQAVLIAQVIGHAVCGNGTGAITNVENADFAALQEIVGAKVCPNVNALINGHDLVDRHAAQRDHAVNMAVNGNHLICFVQIGNQELIADFLGGIALEVTLIAGITNIHGAESSCFACSGSGLAGCQPFR